MIPRLGDGNQQKYIDTDISLSLENDSPSRGRKRALEDATNQILNAIKVQKMIPRLGDGNAIPEPRISGIDGSLENDSPSRGRKLF